MAYLSADERRESIIDAAVDVIASEGLARMTTRRIAERAGAPLGALHYCFRNKEELLDLVFNRARETLTTSFKRVDPSRGAEATIRDSVDAYWVWIRDNIGLHMALVELMMLAIRNKEPGKELYASINDPYGGEVLRSNLRQAAEHDGITLAIPIDDIARFIIHRFDGMTVEYAASQDRAACKRQTQYLADALVAIALPGSPNGARLAAARRRRPQSVSPPRPDSFATDLTPRARARELFM